MNAMAHMRAASACPDLASVNTSSYCGHISGTAMTQNVKLAAQVILASPVVVQ